MKNTNDDTIIIYQEGKKIEFIQIAGVVHNRNYYVILQQKESKKNFVYKATLDENGNENFTLENDGVTVKYVIDFYNAFLNK